MVNKTILRTLVCPQTGSSLVYNEAKQELWCRASGLAYPVERGVFVMLVDKARPLTQAERESLDD